ncbi:NAD-glutamate dehydrogenase [Cellvibrio sp. NN19]|uniref:NAD-glutamate dehydrogenase n=1 Tax=Cellvibrio chitinivorans TaxID=3102792 RepID=UPI002B411754|nr:NAD-glutamate dehydrogenase [Cellvibrio sp. NN19]
MNSPLISQHTLDGFLGELNQYIASRLSGAERESLQCLAKQFFDHYPLEELVGRRLSDVFGGLYHSWQFIQQFDTHQPKLRLFNPTLAEDGWNCQHTVLVVLQKDMPFLVDSIRIELNRRNIAIYSIKSTVLNVIRDSQHQLVSLLNDETSGEKSQGEKTEEALIVMELSSRTDKQELADTCFSLNSVLAEVECVVEDYQPMRAAALAMEQNLGFADEALTAANIQQTRAFIRWLTEDKFTFLGYAEYEFSEVDGQKTLCEIPARRLGVFTLRDSAQNSSLAVDLFNDGMTRFHLVPQVITFSKSSSRARVHRNAYSDYVVVKRFNVKGEVVGEVRFLGLYTSAVYLMNPAEIPLISTKLTKVFELTGLDENSHDGKNFRQLLATFPRNELFLSNSTELYEMLTGIAQINERSMVRLFMRRDPFGKFMHFLIYVPRDYFSTKTRLAIQDLIGNYIGSQDSEFTTYFSESILARVYLVFKLDSATPVQVDVASLQAGIVNITRSWEDHLYSALLESHGEEVSAQLAREYRDAFSAAYQEQYDAAHAVQDIQSIKELSVVSQNEKLAVGVQSISLSLHHSLAGESEQSVRFKIFHRDTTLALSDVIPILENLGFRVVSESTHDINTSSGKTFWLHDFKLSYQFSSNIDFHLFKENVISAFTAIWHGAADSDAFNMLITTAGLGWREVVMLRAYSGYMHQTLFPFSAHYIAAALVNQAAITHKLVELFTLKFDPDLVDEKTPERLAVLQADIISRLDAVQNLNDDRIVRRFLALIENTLRTNFYQPDTQGNAKPYLSLKFSPYLLSDIPAPRPKFEIFVFSTRMEGVHLRTSKVARGGLRWSDRLQDYRTEILGLVKAQQVKNAVIVPSGAKGGFVCKKMPANASRDQQMQEAIACYQCLIRGLLDLTDNLLEGSITKPQRVVCYDDDDAYLVVAADKGTASFSDIANAISAEYNHWLGDAFASGGSQGYDHKGMGITARGAWISVQRHFREKNIDVQSEPITVVGIGDMAGDVFGNGMLLSQSILLVATFNHQHIFIDPNPDSAHSFVERKRLFDTPKTTWDDYDKTLISEGGGVFNRSAKSIVISAQMRTRFAIDAASLTPAELINALLKAPVDLVWNGGIGTYVKAANETHADVGDKANDSLRVNGEELRCKVFGEGGNLGMTQRGRVEYSLNGGACNTDFIDNAAGVDCSDHEVNIKILLNEILANGDLTQKQRNQLLVDMTETVAQLVLDNNRSQTRAIGIAQSEALKRSAEYRRFMHELQVQGRLDRKLEFLPSDDVLLERQTQGKSLTRPELSVLISYAKIVLKEDLTAANIVDDEYLAKFIESAFPHKIAQLFPLALRNHQLRREIVATQIANDMVNTMGISFAQRLIESTGASAGDVAKAYVIARDIYSMPEFLIALDHAGASIPAELQLQLTNDMMRKVRRAARWFLRNRRNYLNPASEVELFAPGILHINEHLPQLLTGDASQAWQDSVQKLRDLGLPEALVTRVAHPTDLYSGLSVVEAARIANQDVDRLAAIYFALGNYLSLPWFSSQISNLPVDNFWQAMAREAYLSDLESQLRSLSVSLIRFYGEQQPLEQLIQRWSNHHQLLIARWKSMVNELQAVNGTDFAMVAVALRDLLDLAQASQHCEALVDAPAIK